MTEIILVLSVRKFKRFSYVKRFTSKDEALLSDKKLRQVQQTIWYSVKDLFIKSMTSEAKAIMLIFDRLCLSSMFKVHFKNLLLSKSSCFVNVIFTLLLTIKLISMLQQSVKVSNPRPLTSVVRVKSNVIPDE